MGAKRKPVTNILTMYEIINEKMLVGCPTQNHLPEPWTLLFRRKCLEWDPEAMPYVVSATGGAVLLSPQYVDHPGKKDAAAQGNLSRAADCVNALAGIKNPARFVELVRDLLVIAPKGDDIGGCGAETPGKRRETDDYRREWDLILDEVRRVLCAKAGV